MTWKQEVQVLRVDWPVYPRRFKHNTIFGGEKQAESKSYANPFDQ